MKDYRLLNSTNVEPPSFFGRITEAIGKSWGSLGSISCKINEVSEGRYEVIFFPALREVYGGKDDGEVCYPGFEFNVGRFVRVFDKSPAPKVKYHALTCQCIPHIKFDGYIESTMVTVRILESPPSGQKAVERLYSSGPKKGQVEAL